MDTSAVIDIIKRSHFTIARSVTLLFAMFPAKKNIIQRNNGPYVLSGGPLIFNVILFKRKAVYTEGAGPVCKCTGQCTLEGYFIVLTVSINNLLQFLSRVFKGPPVNT